VVHGKHSSGGQVSGIDRFCNINSTQTQARRTVAVDSICHASRDDLENHFMDNL
jgi:hypothetical protein